MTSYIQYGHWHALWPLMYIVATNLHYAPNVQYVQCVQYEQYGASLVHYGSWFGLWPPMCAMAPGKSLVAWSCVGQTGIFNISPMLLHRCSNHTAISCSVLRLNWLWLSWVFATDDEVCRSDFTAILATDVGMKSFKHYGQHIPVENRNNKIPLKWAKNKNVFGVHEDL